MNDELYHHGVKGMRWGVRKKEIAKYESERRSALRKEYGIDDAQFEADTAYVKSNDTTKSDSYRDKEYDKYEKLQRKADDLEDKMYSQLEAELKQKYGKDYDRYKRGEKVANMLVFGGVGFAAILGPMLIASAAVNGVAKLGQMAVSKMFK